MAFDSDLSPVGFHDRPGNGQAETVAAGLPAVGGIRPPEAVEDMLLILRRDRAAGVEDADLPLLSAGFQRDPDPSAVIGILQRVLQEDHSQLLDHLFVTGAVDTVGDIGL